MTPKRFITLIIGSMLLAVLLLMQSIKPVSNEQGDLVTGTRELLPAAQKLASAQITAIHVSVSLNREQFNHLEDLNRSFMANFPHMKVTIHNSAPVQERSDIFSAWMELGQQRLNADVMLLANSWVKPFAVRGYLKPTDRVVSGESQSDQLERLIDPLKWNGYVWAVPSYANPYIVVWNEQLLEEAGLSEPPLDWPAFVGAAEALVDAHADVNVVNLASGDLQQLIVWLESLQAVPVNSLNTLDFHAEELAKLKESEWLQSMEGRIGRREGLSELGLANDLLHNRTLAAVLSWDSYKRLDKSLKQQLLVTQNYILYPWMNGGSYVISSSTKHEEAAALWIKEMTSAERQLEAYESFGLLPTRSSLYSGSHYAMSDAAPPAWVAAALSEKREKEQKAAAMPDWPAAWNDLERKWSLLMQPNEETALPNSSP